MSFAALVGLPEDPRKTEFVLSLSRKTKEGKVSWARKGNAFTATIPNGIVANFVTGVSIFGTAPSWELFTVRDRTGNELIQVTAVPMLGPVDPLSQATSQLFAVVSGLSGDELQEAIETLKKL